MDEKILSCLENFNGQTKQRFGELYGLICTAAPDKIEEKLWAGLPSFYAGKNFVRLIPFKNHVNIEAKAVALHKGELSGYKLTPKGMLQIFHDRPIPVEILKTVFRESLI